MTPEAGFSASCAVFSLSQLRRFFASLRMTSEGLGKTAWRGFSAACEAPPFQTRGEKCRLRLRGARALGLRGAMAEHFFDLCPVFFFHDAALDFEGERKLS